MERGRLQKLAADRGGGSGQKLSVHQAPDVYKTEIKKSATELFAQRSSVCIKLTLIMEIQYKKPGKVLSYRVSVLNSCVLQSAARCGINKDIFIGQDKGKGIKWK